jgi:outer membrane lipopolysaccharide assembly protein LptE/RlpB
MKRILLATACLLLGACGQQLDGTYTDETGLSQYTFKSGNKVYLSMLGAETELAYAIEDDKVKISSPQGNLVLTLNPDGSLQGPLGVTLRKKAE